MTEPEDAPFDIDAFEAFMQEQMRWASMQVPFRALSDDVPQLAADIAAFDRDTSSALVAGLLTVPAYQSSGLRIELLAGLVVLHARGKRRATLEDLARWFAMLGASGAAAGEDAAEDVMVTLVATSSEQFRILEGLWESAGFYTQRVLDVLSGMPDMGIYRSVRDSVRALLSVAEIVCMRAGLERYQTGSDARPDALDIASLPTAGDLCARATITHAALQERDVSLEDLAPFLLQSQHVAELIDQEPGVSELERRPLVSVPDGVVLALPTAVTVAIRQRVIDLVLGTRQVGHFDGHYARALSNAIADTTLLGLKSGCPVLWHPTEGGALAGVVVPFDRGHFVVLHFVLPSVESHELGWFKRPIDIHPTLQKALNYSITSNTQQLESQDDFRGGMHLVVMCGWGQGMVIPVTRPDDARWRGEAMSVADLVRASSVEDMSIQRLWRLVSAEKALVDAGVELMNVNGVLNLFAWMQENDGHLVPHGDLDDGRISPEQRLMVSLPLNLLRDLRADADRNVDAHVGLDPRSEPHHLHRVDRGSLFSHPAAERLYACTECLRSGTLLAACEGRTTLWLRVDSPGVSSRDTEFRLWDMVGRWGASVAAALEDGTDIEGAVEITIAFEDVQSELDAVDAQVPTDPLELLRVEVVGAEAVTVHAARGFLNAWREPTNAGERALVTAIIQAVFRIHYVEYSEAEVDGLVASLLPNETGRHFHVLHAHDFTDFVRDALPGEVLGIDEIESATQRIGLGWSVHDGDNNVEGAEACVGLLNRLVDAQVGDLTSRLGELDRTALVERLLLNHEAAHVRELQWQRTSAAVLGLHGDSQDVRDAVVGQLSKLAGAAITSRVLVEIAACEAPLTGGRLPDDLQIQALLAQVELVTRLGGLSDGIHYGVLRPHLRVSALGDILLRDEFGREVVAPMLSQAVGSNYVDSAGGFRRHYGPQEGVDRTEHLLDSEFLEAWQGEMGFGVDEARHLLDAIEDYAIKRRAPTLQIRRGELVALLASRCDAATAERFIDQLLLARRPRWAQPPQGFKSREILPWRFGRRLSIVTRPIVQMNDDDDALYMLAPRLVRSGFFYLLRGAFHGTLDQSFFQTPAMRDAWWGKANEGHTFNALVADQLRAAGWEVRAGIELTAVLNAKLDRDYGDVDVLAWCPGGEDVFVVECKDLSFRRNYSEIAALLSDYQGDFKNGKPDKLKRHLMRVECAASHLPAVARFTGVAAPKIRSCLLVAGLVPMQFASIPALEGTFVGDLDQFGAQFGQCRCPGT
ncbi:hypothetical protein LLE59_20845 [Xanthomonas campestris]|uniref:anti-phage protein Upx n=1 Tax=Xanthomonas campestris TaxID=339 RepID=UPI001E4D413F|nr:anti-phage protein Upx [Xanthomonas campestris]MCC5049754.1 hypothetical protein [Xanthomonas campestris]MCC5058031.1 hypothetical protein [Xanthomonas campestris]